MIPPHHYENLKLAGVILAPIAAVFAIVTGIVGIVFYLWRKKRERAANRQVVNNTVLDNRIPLAHLDTNTDSFRTCVQTIQPDQ